jgi:hypothetical protein
MFSVPQTRYLDAYLVDEQGTPHHLYQYRIQNEVTRAYSRARNLPNESALCDLAERLSTLRWSAQRASLMGRIEHAAATYNETLDQASADAISLDGIWFARRIKRNDASKVIQVAKIEVRVAEIAYDRAENRTHRRPVASAVWERGGACQTP